MTETIRITGTEHSYVIDQNMGGNISIGDHNSFAPKLWDYLLNRFAVSTVLDVGAGLGHFAWYAAHCRNTYVIAIDGLKYNVQHGLHPMILHDVAQHPFKTKVDLVYAVELLEHIEEQYLENVFETFKSGGIVYATHADPGQGGYHHVNCQYFSYWERVFEDHGFIYADIETKLLQPYVQGHHRSGMIFINNNNNNNKEES